ncbi:MAG TPA: class I SAM-dependent methyltransferase [Micromonosporaceae bacterium]
MLDRDEVAVQAGLWNMWAPVYDEWHNRDPAEEIDFLRKRAPADGHVLELGVGTGRVALGLARTGLEVYGLDVSPVQVEALLKKVQASDRVHCWVADMADFDVPVPMDLAYATFSTLFSLLTQDRQVSFFLSGRRALKEGGRLVVQAYVPPPGLIKPSKNLTVRKVSPDGIDVSATVVDVASQRISFQELSITHDGRVTLLPVEQRYSWPSEIDLMARIAGFELCERYENYREAPYGSGSPGHVSVYR